MTTENNAEPEESTWPANVKHTDAYRVLRREYDRRHRNWIKDREDGKPYDDAAEAQHLSLCGFWEAMELLVR